MDKKELLETKEEKGFLATLQRFLGSLFGSYDEEKEKKRHLKEIKKELRKRNKFFRVKGDMALSGLAKMFHEIYLTVGPAQVLFEKYAQSELLKEVLIESFLNKNEKKIVQNITPDVLKERAQKSDLKKLKEKAKEELVQLYSALDAEAIKKINGLYNNMLVFRDFISYDYFFLLKKFDSMMPEQDFTYQPRFENISGEYILEDLKDFLVVFYALNEQLDWEYLFDILKEYRNIDLISKSGWKKILTLKKEIVRSKILLNIVMYLQKDPYYKIKIDRPRNEIVETYLQAKKNGVERTLQEIFQNRKNQQINTLLMNVFGTTAISRTQYYTDKESMLFQKKSVEGYTLVKPVNYLKAFFLDYLKNDVRKMVDLMLIHGKWATSVLSQQLSDTYQQLLVFSDQLIEFDNSLADDGTRGQRMKRMLRVASKDRAASTALQEALNDTNNKARNIINNSAQYIISLGKYIKNLLHDHKAMNGQIIINWKDLENETGGKIDEQLNDVYMKIYYFIQLVQFFIKPKG